MELMTYKTRAVRTLSLLILVAMLAALTPPSITGGSALAQTATTPEITSFSADTANQVSLTWSAVTDADNYQVWRWESAENWVELDGSFEGTTYTDTTVTAGKTYYYQVSADGGTTWSNRVSATVGAYDASTLSIGTVTSSMVPVSWGAVTGATSYELWRYENSWTQIGGTITGTSYDDTSVEIGKTYYYQVMAKGPAGDGAWSNRASATVPSTTPGMPLNLHAAAGDAQVVLTWDVPATDGGSALTGYQYRYQMAGGSWSSWMATSPALSRTATVSSLTNETAHNFEVQAMNANGASPSATASATPMSTPPGIPSGLGTTSTGPTEITLSWTAAAGAASYQLQRRTNGGSWGSPMDAGSGTTYTDTGLTPSTTYDYEVRAVNPAGNSDWSAVVTAATTAPTAPDATTLTATAGASNIMLSWTAPDSNGADLSGYDIDVSGDGADWSDLATKAAGDTSHDHTNLGPGTMNYYRIRAMNSVGYSDWSASAMATVPAVAPGKPTLYATASGTTIMLSWVAPAATGGADITRYTIQVSNDGTTGWGNLANKAGGDSTHDHVLPATATGTTRYYRINATNSAGTGDWSDIASATTAGAAPPRGETPDNTSPRSLNVAQVSLAANQGSSKAGLLLTWLIPAEPPDNDDGTVNLGYEVEVWNPATQTWDSVLHDDNGDENDVTVATKTDRIAPALTTGTPAGGTLQDTGLKGTTEYTYRVRAVDGVGTTNVVRGKWSTQESGTTVAVSPSQPMLTATAMGTNKIVLTWSVPEDGGDDIIGYILAVSDTAPAADADLASPQYLNPAGTAGAAPVLLEAAQQSVTHSMTSVPAALTPRSTWHYQISALNSVADITDPPAATANAAWSDWSAVAMATTGTSVPGKPEEFTVTGATGTFTLTFTNPDTNNGGSDYTSHELQMWDADREEWILLHDGTAANLILAAENNVPTELGANVLRYFRARSKNRNGAGPWETDSDTTTAGAASAPKLTATVNGPDRITLSWTVPENDGGGTITGYVIQFGADGATWTAPDATTTPVTGPGLTNIGANTLSATHTGLTAGQTVYYQVRATTDVAGTATEGTWSASVSASTSTGGVPGATGWDTPDLTPTATSMTIHWSAPQVGGADDPSVTGYDIAMWENGQWTTIASNIASDPTEYVASDLSGDTTYYFSVRAKNANGNGPWSEVRSDDTNEGTPGKPVVTATADGATKIVLTWTAPDSGGATINHYVVQVSNNGTIGWGPLDDAATPNNNVITTNLPDPGATHVSAATNEPAPPLTVTHSGLNGMQKRFYRVAASTAAVGSDPADADIGAWSDVVYETTPAGEPGAPTWPDDDNDPSNGFNALTVTSSSITVAWTAPTANGGSVITGYQIQIWEDGAWMDLMSVGDSTTSYMHSGLPGATQNFYRVRAMNSVGYSKWSATHNGTTSDGKPGAPMLHADQNGSTQIRLTWTAPATGAAADTVVISNFQIQVSSDGQSGWTTPDADPATPLNNIVSDGERVLQTAAAGSTAADTTRNYTDSDLDPATTMYYRVRAVNSAGAVGPWSNKAMASTLGGRPGRPALTATASGTSIINLAWTPPTGDGGSAVTGYDLQYWDGSNGWMDLASLDDSVTAYTHRNIAGGTTKFYRIRAENAAGTGAWSTTAYAMTATTVPSPPTLVATADGAAKIMVTWTAGHDGGLAITRYHLQSSTMRADRTWETWTDVNDSITPGMSMSHTDETGLTGGTTRRYRIRATNSKGTGGWSPLASATTDTSVPGRPMVQVNGVTRGAHVFWTTPPTPTGGSAIIRYEVQRWDAANRRWMDRLTTSSTAFTDSGLTTGKKYFYRVRAVNAMGDGPWSTFAGDEAN